MQVPLLDLKPQYTAIRDEIGAAITEVLESQYFIMGPKVEAFEHRIAEYCGTKHAIGASSGTDALLIAMMGLGIGRGDAVITTPYSFFATAGSICRLGATPVFVDIDPVTYNIDPDAVEKKLASWSEELKPKAILPVHLYGQCADMDALLTIAKKYELNVVEDAAQAIGSEYPSRDGATKAGRMGIAGCFSFFPSKNLGGFGDGGIVTTNSDELADKLRKLRNHGAKPKYYHAIIGGNFRLDAIQAAILDVKLNYLEDWHTTRRENAARYDAALQDSAVVTTPNPVYADHGIVNYHIYTQYVVRVPERDRTRAALKEAGVGCEVYYPVPLHLQECFSALGYSQGDFPESERAAAETLAIPIYPEITAEMQDFVVKTLLANV